MACNSWSIKKNGCPNAKTDKQSNNIHKFPKHTIMWERKVAEYVHNTTYYANKTKG